MTYTRGEMIQATQEALFWCRMSCGWDLFIALGMIVVMRLGMEYEEWYIWPPFAVFLILYWTWNHIDRRLDERVLRRTLRLLKEDVRGDG